MVVRACGLIYGIPFALQSGILLRQHPKSSRKLRKVWNYHLGKSPLDPSDWYSIEITKVLTVFGHAVSSHSGIVSFLEKPADDARARRVLIPVVDRSENVSSN